MTSENVEDWELTAAIHGLAVERRKPIRWAAEQVAKFQYGGDAEIAARCERIADWLVCRNRWIKTGYGRKPGEAPWSTNA